jgi:hypothetical protein
MQITRDEEKLDQIEDILEASPSTLAKFLHHMGASVTIMKRNTTDEFVCIKTSTVHKLYNSVYDQKWNS